MPHTVSITTSDLRYFAHCQHGCGQLFPHRGSGEDAEVYELGRLHVAATGHEVVVDEERSHHMNTQRVAQDTADKLATR